MTRSVKFILLTTMIAMTSLANGTENIGNSKAIVAQHPTVIRSAPVRVNIQKIQKPKLFVGNPHKISIFADDVDFEFLDVDDIITTYRREDLQKIKTDPTDKNPEGLSEEIRWQLFLARQMALLKYREIHG